MGFLQTLLQNKYIFIEHIGERVKHTIPHPTYYPRLFITPLNNERAQVAFGLLTNPL
jgi:hypothetical protein